MCLEKTRNLEKQKCLIEWDGVATRLWTHRLAWTNRIFLDEMVYHDLVIKVDGMTSFIILLLIISLWEIGGGRLTHSILKKVRNKKTMAQYIPQTMHPVELRKIRNYWTSILGALDTGEYHRKPSLCGTSVLAHTFFLKHTWSLGHWRTPPRLFPLWYFSFCTYFLLKHQKPVRLISVIQHDTIHMFRPACWRMRCRTLTA